LSLRLFHNLWLYFCLIRGDFRFPNVNLRKGGKSSKSQLYSLRALD
jgi:hypothetical protein